MNISGSRAGSNINAFIAVLLAGYLGIQLLHHAGDILVPLAISILLGSLYLPMVRYLEKFRIGRQPIGTTIAILFCLILTILSIILLILIFINNLASFQEEWPLLKQKIVNLYPNLIKFIRTRLGLSTAQTQAFVSEKIKESIAYSIDFVGSTLIATSNAVLILVLVPVYTFLILYYRKMLRRGIESCFSNPETISRIDDIIQSIPKVMRQYLSGVVSVMLVLAVINSIGLYFLGVPHPVFFGVSAAILNIIPYVGIFSVALFSAALASLTLDSGILFLLVLLFFVIVHLLEANYITPKIVGNRINLNALAAIFAVIIGGHIWGLYGMILSLPYLAAIRVISEKIPALLPLAIFISEEVPENL